MTCYARSKTKRTGGKNVAENNYGHEKKKPIPSDFSVGAMDAIVEITDNLVEWFPVDWPCRALYTKRYGPCDGYITPGRLAVLERDNENAGFS